MKAHFVTFLSPGTFTSEETTKPIKSWDPAIASEMAHSITERHGATPYGFYFTTRERTDSMLDSKETKRSGTHFLGGIVETVEQVRKRNDPNERILLSNMENNNWRRVITNRNSWRITVPFRDGDTVMEGDWSRHNPASSGAGDSK